MKTWHFFRDGKPLGQYFTARTARDLAANTPAGCEAREVSAPESTQYIAEARAALMATPQAQRERVLGQIKALEESQARPTRELLISPDDKAARERVDAINKQIAALRAKLNAASAAEVTNNGERERPQSRGSA